MTWQTFDTIAGHNVQVQALRRICASRQPAHAYLFEGPPGVGKQTVAWALAARFACLQAQATDSACGDCRSCHSLQRGEHPDISLLARSGRQIKIDQVRQALKRLRFEPVLGRSKVLIVEDADRLREEAANALLKTLEEPARATHFILVTSKPQLLLDTIRSRVQVLRFGPLATEDLERLLLEQGQPRDVAQIAAGLAMGDISRATSLCDPALLAVVDEVARFVLELDRAPPSDATIFVEQHIARLVAVDGSKKGKAKLDSEQLAWTLDAIRAVFRDVLLASAGVDPEELPHARYAALLSSMSQRVEPMRVARVLESIDQMEQSLAYNPNAKVTLEAQLVQAAVRLRGGRW